MVINQATFTPFKELHSEEVHEIITRPPHWLLLWGITVTFGIMILGASATWWIRYPDIITTPFTLSSDDAPRKILARSEGRIHRLLVEDGSQVAARQPLLYLQSTADHEEVLKMDIELTRLFKATANGNWISVRGFAIRDYTKLGELQIDFQSFYQQLDLLKTVLREGYQLNKKKLLLDDVNDLKAMEAVVLEQKELQKRDFELAKEEFKVQEKLFRDKVIPSLEYSREKAKLLLREMPLKNMESSLIQNRTSQTAKQKELLELENIIVQQKSAFFQALQTLRSNIEEWKQRYVLYAPVSGKLSFSEPLLEQLSITQGQDLMAVEPSGHRFRGLVKVPQANLGKVSEGQSVLVKLDGYPYQEFGMIEGTLTQLSPTPGIDSTYWGYVDLPKGLATRYNKKLTYKNGMKGTAEIITMNRRLAERMISTVSNGGR